MSTCYLSRVVVRISQVCQLVPVRRGCHLVPFGGILNTFSGNPHQAGTYLSISPTASGILDGAMWVFVSVGATCPAISVRGILAIFWCRHLGISYYLRPRCVFRQLDEPLTRCYRHSCAISLFSTWTVRIWPQLMQSFAIWSHFWNHLCNTSSPVEFYLGPSFKMRVSCQLKHSHEMLPPLWPY